MRGSRPTPSSNDKETGMPSIRSFVSLTILAGVLAVPAGAQNPPTVPPQGAAPGARGGGRGGRGGRGGGGGVQVMTLITTAWPDGGMIPLRYTQAGPEVSPAIQWSGAPPGTASFVLVFQDADSLLNNSTDGILHWMLWNIPGTSTGIAQGRPDGFE